MKTMFRVFVLGLASVASLAAHAGPVDEQYYEQFNYFVDTENDGDGEITRTHRYLMGQGEIKVNENKYVTTTVTLLLTPGKNFKLYYREDGKYRDDAQSPWKYLPGDMCPAIVEGTWSAPDVDFVPSVAAFQASKGTAQGQNAMAFTLLKALRGPEAVGQKVMLTMGFSNIHPDEMVLPFCH